MSNLGLGVRSQNFALPRQWVPLFILLRRREVLYRIDEHDEVKSSHHATLTQVIEVMCLILIEEPIFLHFKNTIELLHVLQHLFLPRHIVIFVGASQDGILLHLLFDFVSHVEVIV